MLIRVITIFTGKFRFPRYWGYYLKKYINFKLRFFKSINEYIKMIKLKFIVRIMAYEKNMVLWKEKLVMILTRKWWVHKTLAFI